MDFNSGSLPLDLVTLCLDMSTEELTDVSPIQPIGASEEKQLESTNNLISTPQTVAGLVPNEKVEELSRTPASASDSSAAESVSAYVERTVETILSPEAPPADSMDSHGSGQIPNKVGPQPKSSVSERIEINQQQATDNEQAVQKGKTNQSFEEEQAADVVKPTGTGLTDPIDYFTETSEFEDLMDSSGVTGPVMSWNKRGPVYVQFPTRGNTSSSDNESAEAPAGCDPGPSQESRRMSVSGRTLLRRYFCEKDPIELPRGHHTIALTEDQMHTVLKTISDETILSSFHLMKSLLLQATSGKVLTKERCRHVSRSSRPVVGHTSSSGDESTDMGSNSGGYTSGAFNTDDEPGSLSFCLEKEVTQPQGGTEDLAGQCAGTSCTDLLQETAPSPGSGYSLGDYAPLSTLITKPGKTPATKSPPKKRRRYEGRPGKTMKEAYFKGIHWTKTFVTGPLDPLHNQYKFYCRICKTNVSIRSKGAREIVRHYQTETHLRKDQLWRYTHLSRKDSVTGLVTHQVRGRNGVLLTPLELEKGKANFEGALLVDLGSEFPFYEDYLARQEGRKTTGSARDSTQIALIATIVPLSGNIELLRTLWSQVGENMDYQEAFAPFDWSPARLTVSSFPGSVFKPVFNGRYIPLLFRQCFITYSPVSSRTSPPAYPLLTCTPWSLRPLGAFVHCQFGFGRVNLWYGCNCTDVSSLLASPQATSPAHHVYSL